jgi:hypothetical protein
MKRSTPPFGEGQNDCAIGSELALDVLNQEDQEQSNTGQPVKHNFEFRHKIG